MKTRPLATLAVVLMSSTIYAGDAVIATLSIENPSFDSTDEPWENTAGTCVFDAGDGSDLTGGSGPGSMLCEAPAGDRARFGQCVPITAFPPGLRYTVSFAFKAITDANLPIAVVSAFESTDCSDEFARLLLFQPPFGSPTGNWQTGGGTTAETVPGDRSLYIEPEFATTFEPMGAGMMSFDDVMVTVDELILRSTFGFGDSPN